MRGISVVLLLGGCALEVGPLPCGSDLQCPKGEACGPAATCRLVPAGAPQRPRLVATDPPSPSAEREPAVLGTAPPGVMVVVYAAGHEQGRDVAGDDGAFRVTLAAVPSNQGSLLVAASRAKDGAESGLSNALSYVHDDRPPRVLQVTDGGLVDLDAQADTTSFAVGYRTADENGVARVQVAIASSAACDRPLRTPVEAGAAGVVQLTGLSLEVGTIYYACVKAVDLAGNESPWVASDGLCVDPCAGGGVHCDEVATGACTPKVCVPNATSCAGGTLETCSADGTFQTASTCATGRCADATRCSAPESCNGLDDDGNGIVDDVEGCFVPVYRYWNTTMPASARARCYATDEVPGCDADGYALEFPGPVFFLYSQPVPGTVGLIAYDKGDDHLLEREDSGEINAISIDGWERRGRLGYIWRDEVDPPPAVYYQPPLAKTDFVRDLRRYSLWLNPGSIHLFANNPQETAPAWAFEHVRGFVWGSRW